MSQALHIFKKDVRHLRFEIAIAITVTALFTFIETKHALWPVDIVNSRTPASYLALLLLPVAWWMLIGRAIHDEALPGDRQFWITRPYSWRSLLSAKILFILVFINLPMMIADVVILRAYGFPLGPALPGLLWSQVLLMIVFLLPIFALSALTAGFVQLMLAILAPCVIVLILNETRPGPRVGMVVVAGGFAPSRLDALLGVFTAGYTWTWVQSYILYLVIAVAGSAILLWQYRRRGTFVARSLAAATAILVVVGMAYIPWTAGFRIQSWLAKRRVDMSAAHADFVSDDKSLPRVQHQIDDQMYIGLPLQITGLPADVSTQLEEFSAEFDAPDGSMRRPGHYPAWEFSNQGQRFFLHFYVDSAFYKQVKDEPLVVRGELYLTVYGNPQSTIVRVGGSAVPVPRVGVCSAIERQTERQTETQTTNRLAYFATCSSAFRYPRALVSYRFMESAADIGKEQFPYISRRRVSYSPFPAEVGISPVVQDFSSTSSRVPLSQVVVGTMEPLGHVRLKFEINDLRLADFEVTATSLALQAQQLQKRQNQK